MPIPKDRRWRVTGEDENGDIHAFETDRRGRAKEAEKRIAATLKVYCDRRRLI